MNQLPVSSAEEFVWTCAACTFTNPVRSSQCKVCSHTAWICKLCTFENDGGDICALCNLQKGMPAKPSVPQPPPGIHRPLCPPPEPPRKHALAFPSPALKKQKKAHSPRAKSRRAATYRVEEEGGCCSTRSVLLCLTFFALLTLVVFYLDPSIFEQIKERVAKTVKRMTHSNNRKPAPKVDSFDSTTPNDVEPKKSGRKHTSNPKLNVADEMLSAEALQFYPIPDMTDIRHRIEGQFAARCMNLNGTFDQNNGYVPVNACVASKAFNVSTGNHDFMGRFVKVVSKCMKSKGHPKKSLPRQESAVVKIRTALHGYGLTTVKPCFGELSDLSKSNLFKNAPKNAAFSLIIQPNGMKDIPVMLFKHDKFYYVIDMFPKPCPIQSMVGATNIDTPTVPGACLWEVKSINDLL
eukprot:321930_1